MAQGKIPGWTVTPGIPSSVQTNILEKWGFPVPSESRVISFGKMELMEAVVDYCVKIKRPLPQGRTRQMTVSKNAEGKVTLKSDGEISSVSFDESEIAVALILLCNKKGIPLARRAIKSLQIGQDGVLLQMVIQK
jgi:hypothetical protein